MKKWVLVLSVLLFFASLTQAKEKDVAEENIKMEQYFRTLPFRGYHFPFDEITQNKYPANRHYSVVWRNDGTVNEIAAVREADENYIGELNQTYDEALFVLEGRLLEYASFYDDWNIKQTSEIMENADGSYDIVRVTYNHSGEPEEYEAIYSDYSIHFLCKNGHNCQVVH